MVQMKYSTIMNTFCFINATVLIQIFWAGTITLDMYVPPDERVSPHKLSELISNSIQAGLHFILPEANLLFANGSTGSFESFDEIRNLFTSIRSQVLEGWVVDKLKSMVPPEIFKKITRASKEKQKTKFPLPQVIAGDVSYKY